MFMLTVQQKGKNGQAKMHFFSSEMTEFRLGKSSWRNSVRVKNAQGGAAHTDPGELKTMRNSITTKFILRYNLT